MDVSVSWSITLNDWQSTYVLALLERSDFHLPIACCCVRSAGGVRRSDWSLLDLRGSADGRCLLLLLRAPMFGIPVIAQSLWKRKIVITNSLVQMAQAIPVQELRHNFTGCHRRYRQ